MRHSAECIRKQEEIEKLQREYRAKWPRHCRKCRGWGGREYPYDPSPDGVSLGSGSISGFDLCSECSDDRVCPRCGVENTHEEAFSDGVPCGECGWNYPDEGMPESQECDCINYFEGE